MNEYPKYPIYVIILRWEEDGVHDTEYPNRHAGLEPGRVHNSTRIRRMFKEEQSAEDLNEYVMKGMEHRAEKNITNLQIVIKPVEYETWNLTWFAHETFDTGQTDAEALESFEQYVRRYEFMHPDDPGYKALMGAEDRWRWHGSDDEGSKNYDIPAPCRCIHCKKAGMIRINH